MKFAMERPRSLFFCTCMLALFAWVRVSSAPLDDEQKYGVPPMAGPMFHGCADNMSKGLPYCNLSLSHVDRVNDLLQRLTLDEKIGLLSPHSAPYCTLDAAPVPRLGVPGWNWLTEVNTNIMFNGNGPCLAANRCPTVFIGPEGLGASFNRSLWRAKGDVISTELRAYNNLRAGGFALSGFGPNINLVKDPRFGRNSELPGEDPYLSGSYAVEYVHGMQQVSPQGHLKMTAYVKHYTAYNKEKDRWTFVANVSMFDLWDSYLPQYQRAFQEGNASGAMCSYFAPNGIPMCGNDWLMNGVVRKQWGRPDAVFMSDCSAVADFLKNGFAHNESDASAKALNGGLDLYGGWNDDFWTQGFLRSAIKLGLTTEHKLDEAVRRTSMQKMRLGVFDPLENQTWTNLGLESVNSTLHQQVAFEAALQGLVLLKNSNPHNSGKPVLPLQRGIRLAIVGPFAVESTGLASDYSGGNDWMHRGGGDTIGAALLRVNGGTTFAIQKGVDVNSADKSGIAPALEAVQGADATVMVLGIEKAQEHEGIDRQDTRLPGLQEVFAHQVYSAAGSKPVILVLCNGGIVSIDGILNGSSAIVEAFNPVTHGPRALAETLFGYHNRWGKLPVTIYGENYTKELDAAGANISDYAFADGPGRSYRYFKGVPLFPFGWGLSYMQTSLGCKQKSEARLRFSCSVMHSAGPAGDEVVMVFHRVGSAIRSEASKLHPVPFKQLVQFDRITLSPEETTELEFAFEPNSFAITRADGSKFVYSGMHELIFSVGHGSDVVLPVGMPDILVQSPSIPSSESHRSSMRESASPMVPIESFV
eukprot:TRINITY_DN23268_c0_g1_i1.p1 TRINITY_DN23268_c0_g1~~TRINITY_DN23268_c0_g1_i1.p1  ORF type:complete len:813 (-),score=128.88 TRINITY_DN23268_c0_g1_i1:19-2457(-)